MDRLNLHYEAQGDVACPVVIIVHGFFASARNWRSIATKLAQHYYVVALDMRNHGASPHAEPMDYPTMAEDLKRFIVQQGFESVSLIGHSMGGKVCMWFALQYPAYVQRLIIADIAPTSYTHNFDRLIAALQALPLEAMRNRKQADVWLAPFIAAADYRQFLLQNLVLKDDQYTWRINLEYFKRAAPAITAFPVADNQHAFAGEVLVLAGEHSDFVQVEAFKKLFPQAIFQTLLNAAHWLHVQAPEDFLSAVQGHLKTAGAHRLADSITHKKVAKSGEMPDTKSTWHFS